MKTYFNNSKSIVRIATVTALFGFLAFVSEAAWGQQGTGRGSAGGGNQAASKSKQKSSMPKVNKDDKTLQFGKTISAGPMPTVDRDDKHRRRGTYVQNGANPSANGGGRMPSFNMHNNQTPENMGTGNLGRTTGPKFDSPTFFDSPKLDADSGLEFGRNATDKEIIDALNNGTQLRSRQPATLTPKARNVVRSFEDGGISHHDDWREPLALRSRRQLP